MSFIRKDRETSVTEFVGDKSGIYVKRYLYPPPNLQDFAPDQELITPKCYTDHSIKFCNSQDEDVAGEFHVMRNGTLCIIKSEEDCKVYD